MPKVLLLVNVGSEGVMHAAGSTLEVSKETAADWRKRGMCRPIAQEAPAGKPDETGEGKPDQAAGKAK